MGGIDANASTAMDVAGEEALKSPRFSINVLQLIKSAQTQHGLRHGDYTRYRRYCTARLRRLYKSLKFTHGRGKYVRRQITGSIATDVRYLHVVLYLTERAWSCAMEIKQSDGERSRKHFHLVGRLSKAVKWSHLFSQLCAEKADPRTSLEAEAYASYMKGSYLLEREENWENALRNFKSARAIYEELGKYGDVETQVLCRQRVDELEPSVRYCLYKMGQSNIHDAGILDLSTQEGPAFDLLQAKLEAVMMEARTQQATTLMDLQWLGQKFPIKNAKARVCILKGQQLEKDILGTSLSPEKKLTVYDKIFGAYQDAKRHIRDDLVVAGNAEDVKDELTGLDKAVGCILLQRTIDRNKLLVTLAKNRYYRQQHGAKEDKIEKNAKPEELVRLYDILIQNVMDLSDLTTSGRTRRTDEASFAAELDVKRTYFQAERCYYLAQYYNLAGKYAEAYVLLKKAREHADSALANLHNLKNSVSFDEVAFQELKDILERCRQQSCLVHATAVEETTKLQNYVEKGVASIALKQPSSRKDDVGYLLDRLDKYEPVIGVPSSKESVRIAQLPPPFQAVPCKPIVLDTAVNLIEFPTLEGRLKKEDKKKGLFGWWRS